MSNTESDLETARSILAKLTKFWFEFEKWPEGDGWLCVDGSTDLTKSEVDFLSTIVEPNEEAGPGGLPDDWDEEDL